MSREEELSNRIFSNPLLLETIVDFAFRDGGEVNYSTVQSCRLVNSIWRKSVSKCLRKSRDPLFSYSGSEAKYLKEFDVMVTNSGRGIPPIQMSCGETYLEENDYSYFLEVLTRFQSGLVSLGVAVPDTGCVEIPSDFQLLLPLLRNLHVKMGIGKETSLEVDTSGNVTSFLQLILSGCSELKHFTLREGEFGPGFLPLGFENVELPATLTELTVNREVESKHLRGLMKGPLPKLTKLTITFGLPHFDDGLVFDVVGNVSETLKRLTFRRQHNMVSHYLAQEPAEIVQLPKMKRLDSLIILAPNIKCTTVNHTAEIGDQLPMLQTIYFGRQPLACLRNGIEAARFPTVSCVYAHMGSADLIGDEYFENYTLEAPKLIFEAFPNIVRLHLTLDYYQNVHGLVGLSFLFEHFHKLRDLSLNLGVAGQAGGLLEKLWNSVLLGISCDGTADCTLSKPKEENWNMLALERDSFKSITNMTELRRLHLQLTLGEHSEEDLVCCDAAFQFGFFNMPRLENINLRGDFTASPDIVRKWRGSGRIFKSLPTLRQLGYD